MGCIGTINEQIENAKGTISTCKNKFLIYQDSRKNINKIKIKISAF